MSHLTDPRNKMSHNALQKAPIARKSARCLESGGSHPESDTREKTLISNKQSNGPTRPAGHSLDTLNHAR
jgi:hypothetical protein